MTSERLAVWSKPGLIKAHPSFYYKIISWYPIIVTDYNYRDNGRAVVDPFRTPLISQKSWKQFCTCQNFLINWSRGINKGKIMRTAWYSSTLDLQPISAGYQLSVDLWEQNFHVKFLYRFKSMSKWYFKHIL